MSNNPSNKSPATPKPTKVIETQTFHQIFDGSKSGHPGYIIWKNDDHNLYLAIKFGTTSNKNNTKMNYSIRKGDKENLYYTKLFLGKRKNFGKNELTEMIINEEKLQEILAEIDFLNPTYSSDIRRHDKRFYNWAIKNPLYQGQLSDPMGPADDNTIQNDSKNVNKILKNK